MKERFRLLVELLDGRITTVWQSADSLWEAEHLVSTRYHYRMIREWRSTDNFG